MAKIVVLGANGMLGHALSKHLEQKQYKVTRLTREVFDVLTAPLESLHEQIISSDFLINCIVNNPRSTNYREAIEVNSLFPRKLARFCSRNDTRLIHISTNGVFSGKKGSYREDEVPDAEDLYGVSKFLGEASECMVLRSSIIGTEKHTSNYLLQWAISQKGKGVQGFTNHYWNGITTLAMARAIESIIQDGLYTQGVFHVYSNTAVSKYKLLSFFNEVYELGLTIDPIASSEASNRTLGSIHGLSEQLIDSDVDQQLKELKRWDSS
jgi:dTDP-4-dehydrorhamnose reductase